MDKSLPVDVPLLGVDGYHRAKTVRFLSDAAQHVSGQQVVWKRQDWEVIVRMLPGTGEVASEFDLGTFEKAVAGCQYLDRMLAALCPRAKPRVRAFCAFAGRARRTPAKLRRTVSHATCGQMYPAGQFFARALATWHRPGGMFSRGPS